MSDLIKIVEVGPRDGLQNEKAIVSTSIKLQFIEKLIAAGLKTIEATSFVSPKWVPQMADHLEIVKNLPKKTHVRFPVLIPNQQGFDNALAYHVQDIAVIAAASETFSQKNINCSIKESLQKFIPIIQQAKAQHIRVRGYVSCALGCPYEGKIEPQKVAMVAQQLFTAGCEEISLGDTIGVGTPQSAKKLIQVINQEIPLDHLAVHFHDTYGQALANIYACLDLGIRTIDSSVAGLGGCPYAKGASGNVATEEVAYLLQGLGLTCGIDLDKLIDAGEFICQQLKQFNRSKVAIATLAKRT